MTTVLPRKKMLNASALSAFGLAIVLSIGTGLHNASAIPLSNLVCIDSNTAANVLDESPVPLNTPISCSSSTANPLVTSHEIVVTDGTGANITDSGGSGASVSTSFTANVAGEWTVKVLYFGEAGIPQGQELANFKVSFMVLPESPIGIAAITGSSLAALGAFVGLRKLRSA